MKSFVIKTGQVGPTRQAFTLIELLVVIAIIALLAAILFPVFSRARENARKSSCSNNIKQIGLGLMQYSQDYDETMVSGRMVANTGLPSNGYMNYVDLLQPYVKSYQLFRCPSNTRSNTDIQDGLLGGVGSSRLAKISYMTPIDDNTGGAGSDCAIGARESIGPNLSDFTNTSQTIAIVEGNANNTDFRPTGSYWNGPSAGDSGGNPALYFGHMGTANFLFADGHVKALKPLQTVSPVMGGTGAINMWNRFGTNYAGADLTNTMDKLNNASKKYD